MLDSIYQDGRRSDSMFGDDTQAIRFWVERFVTMGGPVLELACGTGKYVISASAKGLDIVGLDISEPMLTEARRKARPNASPLNLVVGDMRAFQLGSRFRCILIVGNSLCHLITNRGLESCLRCIRDHLEPKGWLLIDTFVRDIHLLSRDSHTRYPFASFLEPHDGQEVVMEYTHVYDSATQVNHVTTITQEPCWPEQVGSLSMRMYLPQELDAHLCHNGFATYEKLGGYEGKSFGLDSKK